MPTKTIRQSPVYQWRNCCDRIYPGGETSTEALFEGVGIFEESNLFGAYVLSFLAGRR